MPSNDAAVPAISKYHDVTLRRCTHSAAHSAGPRYSVLPLSHTPAPFPARARHEWHGPKHRRQPSSGRRRARTDLRACCGRPGRRAAVKDEPVGGACREGREGRGRAAAGGI